MQQGLRFLILSTLPLVVVMLAGSSSLAVWFDRTAYDFISQRYQPVEKSRNDVVLIDIDRESIDRLAGWPFNRAVHAKVIERLSSADVSSITYNVAFIDADLGRDSGDELLLSEIKQSGRVVLPLIAENGQELRPLGRSMLPGATLGHADLSLDADAYLRRSYLHAGIGFPRWPSLSLASLNVYAPVKADDFSGLRTPYLHVGFSKLWSRDYELLLPLGLETFVGSALRYPLWAVLDGSVPPEKIQNKAVFVGISDSAVEKKLKVGVNGQFSSTEVHAFIFNALNRGDTLSPSIPLWAVTVGILATLCWGVFLTNLALGWRLAALCTTLMLTAVPILLLQLGYWLSILPTLLGIISLSMVFIGLRLLSSSTVMKKAPN